MKKGEETLVVGKLHEKVLPEDSVRLCSFCLFAWCPKLRSSLLICLEESIWHLEDGHQV